MMQFELEINLEIMAVGAHLADLLQHIKFSLIPKTFFPDLLNHMSNSPHLTEDDIGKLVKTLQQLQKTEPSAVRRRPNSPVNNFAPPTPAILGGIKQALEVMTDDMEDLVFWTAYRLPNYLEGY